MGQSHVPPLMMKLQVFRQRNQDIWSQLKHVNNGYSSNERYLRYHQRGCVQIYLFIALTFFCRFYVTYT